MSHLHALEHHRLDLSLLTAGALLAGGLCHAMRLAGDQSGEIENPPDLLKRREISLG